MTQYRLRKTLPIALFIVIAIAWLPGIASSAASPTSTPEPGLRIHGTVRLAFNTGPGLPGVKIIRGYAGPGPTVAVTDSQGNYQTEYDHLNNRERVTVYAELAGYTLEPPQYVWEQEANRLSDQEISFVAIPMATTCSLPAPVPVRLLVSQSGGNTIESSTHFTIWAGISGPMMEQKGIISVVGPAGTVSQQVTLSTATGFSLESPLIPLTTNYFTVYGQFEYSVGCTYITGTKFDSEGNWLRTVQSGITPTGVAATTPTKNS